MYRKSYLERERFAREPFLFLPALIDRLRCRVLQVHRTAAKTPRMKPTIMYLKPIVRNAAVRDTASSSRVIPEARTSTAVSRRKARKPAPSADCPRPTFNVDRAAGLPTVARCRVHGASSRLWSCTVSLPRLAAGRLVRQSDLRFLTCAAELTERSVLLFLLCRFCPIANIFLCAVSPNVGSRNEHSTAVVMSVSLSLTQFPLTQV